MDAVPGSARRRSGIYRAAAVTAVMVALVLAVLIGEIGTLAIVAPPALVAAAPLAWTGPARERVALAAAAALVVWSVLGLTLLGSYFLPSAVLLLVAVDRDRRARRVAGGQEPKVRRAWSWPRRS